MEVLSAVGRWDHFASLEVPAKPGGGCVCMSYRNSSLALPGRILHPRYENDVVPVILEKPDHDRTLAVALHIGHRFTDVEGRAYPAHRYRVSNPRCQAFHLINLSLRKPACDSPPATLAASGTYSHVHSLMQRLSRHAARSG
jgi:hypothetical protein